MIRMLQKRFVVAAMTAVTLLLVALIGVINVTNVVTTMRQTDRLLDFLSQAESMPHRDPPSGERRGGFTAPRFDADTRMSSLYFTATVGDRSGEVHVNISRIATVTEAEALGYVEKARESGKADGRIDRFRYRVTPRDGDTLYVFLDTTAQIDSITHIAVLSSLAGLACFGVMLLVVILLSKRAIAPTARNIERQKQFVTDAGHELKTPIAIILANIEALELHDGESKWSRNIREQAARLTDLTQNMLTLAKADEARKSLNVTEFSLSALVAEYAEMFREPMAQRALLLSASIADGVTLTADRGQTARVLSILLDNAQRYAKEGSTVSLTLVGTQLRIENGCEKLPDCPPEKLFDRFYRGDGARTGGGYGIGLSAAQALVTTAGGSIKAEYPAEDRIVFTVDFT